MDEQPAAAPNVATVPSGPHHDPRRVVTGRLHWRRTFAALRHPNYRLFFGGQLLSVIGTWMQQVALGWLVYELTASAFMLGLTRFVSAIPITLLTLMAGVLADRVEKRRVVVLTESVSVVLAMTLAALAFFGVIQIWHILLIGLLEGITDAFDIPTRQSLMVELVGKEDLMNAIALNSSLFNGARVFGPALAGMLLGVIGVAGLFFLNGLSYLAVIAAYLAMRLPSVPRRERRTSIWHESREAIQYVRQHRVLRVLILLVTTVSVFGFPYSVLLPAFARDQLGVGASGFGFLMAANGIGALAGALTLATLGDGPRRRQFFFAGLFGFAVFVTVFAWSTVYWLSALALVGTGFCMIIFFATANTSVQTRVPDAMRGRVMGIYSFAFLGLAPTGSLLAGALAKATSATFAVSLGAGVCLLAGLLTFRMLRTTSTLGES